MRNYGGNTTPNGGHPRLRGAGGGGTERHDVPTARFGEKPSTRPGTPMVLDAGIHIEPISRRLCALAGTLDGWPQAAMICWRNPSIRSTRFPFFRAWDWDAGASGSTCNWRRRPQYGSAANYGTPASRRTGYPYSCAGANRPKIAHGGFCAENAPP